MDLFSKLLVFTGLRKEYVVSSTENKGIINFIKRRTITSKKEILYAKDNDIYSQPRNITRTVYERTYNRALSPIGHIRNDVVIDVPPIQGLDNVGNNDELREQFRREQLKDDIKENLKITFSWLYTFFIILILWVQPLYTLIHVIKENKDLTFHMPTLCFDFIYPIQYIFCLIYFSNDHFEDFYLGKEKELNKKFPSREIIVIFSILFVVAGILFLFIGLFVKNDIIYPDLIFPELFSFNLASQVFIIITLTVSWIMGRITLFIQVCVFCITFCKHCLIIKKFIKFISKEKPDDLITINGLSMKIIQIRYDLETSVDNFKNFFSALTLLGAVSIGFLIEIIKEEKYDGFPWISFSFYLIFQLIFLIIINKVENYRENLVSYIRNGRFVKKYLYRYNENEIAEKFQDNTDMIVLNFSEENSTTIDWLVVNNILSEGWSQFTVLGIPVSDGSLIKRGIALVTLIITFNGYFRD